MKQTAAEWLTQAEANLRADNWREALRCLRATENETGEAETLRWKTFLARLYLMQGLYDDGDKLLDRDNLFGASFTPPTRALARLRESFYAARHWRTPLLTLPAVPLEAATRTYVESDLPEGSFLDLAQWEAWLLRYPSAVKKASADLLELWDAGVFSGQRLLPSGLEALLAEVWQEKRAAGAQDYPRKTALETAGIQKEFGAVMAYLCLLEALHSGDNDKAAASFDLVYSETGICLWLRRLPRLAEIGSEAQREQIIFQLDKADVWLENQTGAKIAQTDYAAIIKRVGKRLYQDAFLSARAREEWRVRLGIETTV